MMSYKAPNVKSVDTVDTVDPIQSAGPIELMESIDSVESTNSNPEDVLLQNNELLQIGREIHNEMKEDNQTKRNIFRKKEEQDTSSEQITSSNRRMQSQQPYTVLSSKDIASSIPQNASTTQLNKIPLNSVEWRWRFFKIGERKMVEVSFYDGQNRIYMDYMGNRIPFDMDNSWNQYVVKVLYAYVKS
jgi:hypothetical protein